MNIKKLFYFNFTIYFFIIFLFSLSSISIAANEPQIINKMTSAFESIEGWLLKLSTPAAAVAVGTGIFMKKIIFNLILVILLLFIFSIQAFASTPKLVNKVNDAFKEIEEWILKISTPAAAVAICSGALMRKFSFGDEEKIRTGKKLITGSLFSYAFILAIDLILSAIKTLIS